MDAPEIFKSFKHIVAAQTTRDYPFRLSHHQISASDLKLSEEQNEINKSTCFKSLGVNENQITYGKQVHDNKIAVINHPVYLDGYDAFITNQKNVVLLVSIADCTPVLIYDSLNHAVAAIHAGWRGTEKQIVTGTLKEMNKQFGTIGENCFAYIGTCISEKFFEVGNEVAIKFDQQFIIERGGKLFVNLKSANQHQLLQFGVPVHQIEISPNCTFNDNKRYFSYRKENGKTGRMYALIGIRDED